MSFQQVEVILLVEENVFWLDEQPIDGYITHLYVHRVKIRRFRFINT